MDIIWENGILLNSSSNKSVDIYSGGFRYGIVLFDALHGIEFEGKYAIFRPQIHICRFLNAVNFLNLEHSFNNSDILEGIKNVVINNKPQGKFYIRVFAYSNSKDFLGTECSIIIFLIESKYSQFQENVNLWYDDKFKYFNIAIPNSIKCTSHYVNRRNLLINFRKNTKSTVNDIVFFDEENNILETSKANIFIIKGEKIYTPSDKLDILNGITRQSLFKVLIDSGKYDLHEVKQKSNFLNDADEIFLSSTSLGIEVVNSINNRKLNATHSEYIKDIYNLYLSNNSEWFYNFT